MASITNLKISRSSDMSNPTTFGGAHRPATINTSDLIPNTNYYAQAVVTDGGTTLATSSVVAFTTTDCFKIVNEANNTNNVCFNYMNNGTLVTTQSGWDNDTYKFSINLEYSLNGADWVEWQLEEDWKFVDVELRAGEWMYVRGKNTRIGGRGEYENANERTWTVSTSDRFSVRGYLASLTGTSETLANSYRFAGMFRNNQNIVSAEYLDFTDIPGGTAFFMFMFTGSSLVTAPRTIPCTTLQGFCYYYMFKNCTSLTTLPILYASEYGQYCCYEMFSGCTSITDASGVITSMNKMVFNCCTRMFQDCTALRVPPSLPFTGTAEGSCYGYMFLRCSALETAPVIRCTKSGFASFSNMFNGCSRIREIEIHVEDWSTRAGYETAKNWTIGVAANGTFKKNRLNTNIPRGVDGIPDGWTVVDL